MDSYPIDKPGHQIPTHIFAFEGVVVSTNIVSYLTPAGKSLSETHKTYL